MSPEERLRRILRYIAGEDELPTWMHQQSGWAQSGPLVTYTPDRGNPVKLMVERFDRAAMYTVQIGLNTGNTIFPVKAEAEVIWSINGTPIRRLVSVGQGVSISGVTESARVTVYDATQPIDDEVPQEYVALINVAPGPRAATTLPPILEVWPYAIDMSSNTDTTVDVPPNAGVVGLRISVNNTASAPATIQMTDGNLVFDVYQVQPGENAIFVPLASGTTQIVVTNPSMTEPITVSGQWAIDG